MIGVFLITLDFDQLFDAQYYHKKIKVSCSVSGAAPPYSIPKIVSITYTDNNKEVTQDFVIEAGDEQILKFIDVPESWHKNIIKELFGFLENDYILYDVKETQNIQPIFILPLPGTDRTLNARSFSLAYVIGPELEINAPYEFEGYQTAHPRTQKTVCVFTKATKLKSDLDEFNLALVKDDLREFQPVKETVDAIWTGLNRIYKYYASNFTGIHGRFDIHLAVDLTFHSVLWFKFNQQMTKGWLDTILFGDTGCGKSDVALKLMNYFQCGEMVAGDGISQAGLIGGVEQIDRFRTIQWGKLVTNDQRLLIIDEATSISPELWENLTSIRSLGVADVTKIIKGKANARTRLIWISNPKDDRRMSSIPYGITALKDIVAKPEDLRRFDLAVVVGSDEVPSQVMYPKDPKKEPTLFDPQLDRDLIKWAWSRKPNDIIFTGEASEAIREMATHIEDTYTDRIPLLTASVAGTKIARLAISLATRLYSHVPKDSSKVLVKKVHIDCSKKIYKEIYGKAVSGYIDYSMLERSKVNQIEDNNYASVRSLLKSYSDRDRIMNYFLQHAKITVDDFSIYMRLPTDAAKLCIGDFVQRDCLRPIGYNSYYKEQAFTTFLKKIQLRKEEDL